MNCLHCPHPDYSHEDVQLGAKCLVEYGALGDSSLLEADAYGETCWCPGFEPAQSEVRV